MGNATLVIMAAGLGSRYGGNKQADRIGPDGELLMEYSAYDAIRAGFDKVVFVVRPEMEGELCSDWRNRSGRPAVGVRQADGSACGRNLSAQAL